MSLKRHLSSYAPPAVNRERVVKEKLKKYYVEHFQDLLGNEVLSEIVSLNRSYAGILKCKCAYSCWFVVLVNAKNHRKGPFTRAVWCREKFKHVNSRQFYCDFANLFSNFTVIFVRFSSPKNRTFKNRRKYRTCERVLTGYACHCSSMNLLGLATILHGLVLIFNDSEPSQT